MLTKRNEKEQYLGKCRTNEMRLDAGCSGAGIFRAGLQRM